MAKIKWNDELSVDVERIDHEHKELIRISNALLNAVSLGRETRILENVIRKLREYTVFHFSNEEKLMESLRYPKRGEHASEHIRLRQNVKDYQHLLYKKEDLTPDELLVFLKGWLLNHILTFDRELARFINDQEVQEKTVEVDTAKDTPE